MLSSHVLSPTRQTQGSWTWGSQGTSTRKKEPGGTRRLLWPLRGRPPSSVPPHSIDPPRLTGWERTLPLLPGGLKPHFKKGTEDGRDIYIWPFWGNIISHNSLSHNESVRVLGYKQQKPTVADLKKKNEFLWRILRVLRLKRKSWKPGLEMSQNQGRLGNRSLGHRRIKPMPLPHQRAVAVMSPDSLHPTLTRINCFSEPCLQDSQFWVIRNLECFPWPMSHAWYLAPKNKKMEHLVPAGGGPYSKEFTPNEKRSSNAGSPKSQ